MQRRMKFNKLCVHQSVKGLEINHKGLKAKTEFYVLLNKSEKSITLYGRLKSIGTKRKRSLQSDIIQNAFLSVSPTKEEFHDGIPRKKFIGPSKVFKTRSNQFISLTDIQVNDKCEVTEIDNGLLIEENELSISLRQYAKFKLSHSFTKLNIKMYGKTRLKIVQDVPYLAAVVKNINVCLKGESKLIGFVALSNININHVSKDSFLSGIVAPRCNILWNGSETTLDAVNSKANIFVGTKNSEQICEMLGCMIPTFPEELEYYSGRQRDISLGRVYEQTVEHSPYDLAILEGISFEQRTTPTPYEEAIIEGRRRATEAALVQEVMQDLSTIRVPPVPIYEEEVRVIRHMTQQNYEELQNLDILPAERQPKLVLGGNTNYVDEEVDMDDPMACIICYSNKRAVVTNCGHQDLCVTCAKKHFMDKDTCPQCRAILISAVVVFDNKKTEKE